MDKKPVLSGYLLFVQHCTFLTVVPVLLAGGFEDVAVGSQLLLGLVHEAGYRGWDVASHLNRRVGLEKDH